MKNWMLAGLTALVVAVALAPTGVEAKRLGGGKSVGMQRSAPDAAPARPATPAQQAAPAAAPGQAAAAAAAPKRNWMGPLAGLAAGLGIAALMSHLGMGEAFGSFIMMALLAVLAVVAIRFVMARMGNKNRTPVGGPSLASAGGPAWQGAAQPAVHEPVLNRQAQPAAPAFGGPAAGSAAAPGLTALGASPASLPADFDAEGFERTAKMLFIRLQAANDTGDLNDLRAFTTPEMFAAIKMDLQDRNNAAQTTDVVKVDAQVISLAQEGERQVVSVRFHGQIREAANEPVNDFDETWHLVRFGDNPAWSISGIQQRA